MSPACRTELATIARAKRATRRCDDDKCLIQSAGAGSSAARAASRKVRPFRPEKWASKPRAWLVSTDIDRVMRQYEAPYPHFVYLGTLASDFMGRRAGGRGGCVTDLCGRDWTKRPVLYGSVINTDVHTGLGKHWVALMLDCRDLRRPVSYFYDSVADKPPAGLKHFWRAVASQFKGPTRAHFLRHSVRNTKVHQRSSTECGNFAMLALDAVLRGADFSEYCSRPVTDRAAFDTRSEFFT